QWHRPNEYPGEVDRMNVGLQEGGGSAMRIARAARPAGTVVLALAVLLSLPAFVRAGKLSWLDGVVQEVILEAKAGSQLVARGAGHEAARVEVRGAGRLFLAHDADEGLEHLVRQSQEWARAGRQVERPAEALLQSRFSRLLKQDPQALRSFAALEPAEKRLV